MTKTREINHEAWLDSALGFIRDQGFSDSFRDWCGGWPCPAAPTPSQADRIEALEAALREIADETEVHTKLNQERLCCKFQHIARSALTGEKQ